MNKLNKDVPIIHRFLFSLPAVVIALIIFLLSNSPHPELPRIGLEWEDKVAHILAYFVFGLSVLMFVLTNSNKSDFKFVAIITILIGSIYGLTDEFHQYFVPGRDVEFFDWVADVIGIVLSLLLIKSIKNKIVKKYVKK